MYVFSIPHSASETAAEVKKACGSSSAQSFVNLWMSSQCELLLHSAVGYFLASSKKPQKILHPYALFFFFNILINFIKPTNLDHLSYKCF